MQAQKGSNEVAAHSVCDCTEGLPHTKPSTKATQKDSYNGPIQAYKAPNGEYGMLASVLPLAHDAWRLA